ncbi:MAG: PIN domain-containing protein [Acidobacteriaceae bacterium]
MLFFDTSVLIPAFQPPHVHHEASNLALARARKEKSACAAHSLAEFYSVTTRLPASHRLTPEQALICIEQIAALLHIVSLDSEEYLDQIRIAAEKRVPGGQFYDALLVACARKAGPQELITWNLRHFQALAPDLVDRIVTP